MKKVIKLKESDIRNAVLRVISEQSAGQDESNPLDMIKPSPRINPAPSAPTQQGNTQFVDRPTTHEVILKKKIAIRTGLKRVMQDIKDLIVYSGINPETNNIARDIEKIGDKFESLFGEPTPKEEGGDTE